MGSGQDEIVEVGILNFNERGQMKICPLSFLLELKLFNLFFGFCKGPIQF